ISRVTDPPVQGRFENLVLATLLEDPALDATPDVKEELKRRVDDAVESAEPIRAHRSKYIAHLDHAVALDQTGTALPGLKRSAAEAVLGKPKEAYRFYGSAVKEVDYGVELHALGGADALVSALETSERWQRMKSIKARRATEQPPPSTNT